MGYARGIALLALLVTGTLTGCLKAGGDAAKPAATPQTPARKPDMHRLLLFGDSITLGAGRGITEQQTFGAILKERLSAAVGPVELINAGVGGEHGGQALLRLDRDVISRQPGVVTIMYGANDQVLEVGQREPLVPLPQYEKNLREMVSRLRAAGIRPVLMTPTPLGKRWDYGTNPPYNTRGNNCLLVDYAREVRKVALDLDVPLVDNFGAWAEAALVGTDLDALMVDGCHPNGPGHELVAQTALPVLLKVMRAR